jgi:hypothetical protein
MTEIVFKCDRCGGEYESGPCFATIDIQAQGGVIAFYPVQRCLISSAKDADVRWELMTYNGEVSIPEKRKDTTKVCIIYEGYAPNMECAIPEIVDVIKSYEGSIIKVDDDYKGN